MKLLPYHAFTLATAAPVELILERLSAKVETTKGFRISRNHAPYQGTVSAQGFHISRIIHYRNSFLPIIRGRFESQASGTIVHIQMGLHPFVTGFLGFWMLSWYGGVIPLALTGAISVHETLLVVGAPTAIVFVFGWAFWYEANRSQGELTEILQGKSL